MPDRPERQPDVEVRVTSRKMSLAEARMAAAPDEARRRRGREHYAALSVREAQELTRQMADPKRAGRLTVAQTRFPRLDIRERKIERVDFVEVDLEDVRFHPPRFQKSITLRDCTFRNALIHHLYRNVVFEDVVFDHCSLFQFYALEASFLRCRFLDSEFLDMSYFRSCRLENVEMGIRSRDLSWTDSTLIGFRLGGTIGRGGLNGCACENVDVSGCQFAEFAFALNTGRIDFPDTRECFVLDELGAAEGRRVLGPQLDPRSLSVMDKAFFAGAWYVPVLASSLKDAPQKDLILDVLYRYHVSHS